MNIFSKIGMALTIVFSLIFLFLFVFLDIVLNINLFGVFNEYRSFDLFTASVLILLFLSIPIVLIIGLFFEIKENIFRIISPLLFHVILYSLVLIIFGLFHNILSIKLFIDIFIIAIIYAMAVIGKMVLFVVSIRKETSKSDKL